MKYLLVFIVIGLISCEPRRNDITTTGYVPVYATRQAVNTITTEPVKATVHPGKIYAYGNYLFQVEEKEGIHIIDNSNSLQPKKISFLKIPSCSELAIRSNFLYTNNLDDLVVFDLTNINSPQLMNRVKKAFPDFGQSYPPFTGVYFECPDPSKGVVTGWELKALSSFKCRR